MPVNVNQQTLVFLMCILTGMASGIICDVLSITAKKLRFNKSAFFIQDMVIWFIILAFFFSVIYRLNGAVLRWYVFLGAALGALLYILLLRNIIVKIITEIVNFLFRIVWKILRILAFPLKKILKLLRPAFKVVQSARKKLGNFVQKNIEKLKRINILLKKI